MASSLVNTADGFLAEAAVVGFYLIFLLLEVRRFPRRVRRVSSERADRVRVIIDAINRAMTSYLRAKVLSSLLTAFPIAAVLWAFGVSFPGMWGALAFIGNFIPYVGSLVALVLPVLLASHVWGETAGAAASCKCGMPCFPALVCVAEVPLAISRIVVTILLNVHQ